MMEVRGWRLLDRRESKWDEEEDSSDEERELLGREGISGRQ